MLRLLDARVGSHAEVRSARPGLLRVCAYAPGVSGELDIIGLRMLLIADLLARTAEWRNWQVLTVLAFAGQPFWQVTAFEQAADALGIHLPAARASSDDAQAALGGPSMCIWSGTALERRAARTGLSPASVPCT